LKKSDLEDLKRRGFNSIYLDSINKIYSLKMYDSAIQSGWTRILTIQTRKYLIPEMIKMVCLAWYQAALLSVEEDTL